MPPSQLRFASSSPFPNRRKGLNPSFSLSGLRSPVRSLPGRTPAPVPPAAAAIAFLLRLRGHQRPVPLQREGDAEHLPADAVCQSARVAAPPDGAQQCGSACCLRAPAPRSRRGTRSWYASPSLLLMP
uniref:Uncharacterized protein n=1 Tax=Arundo donax TaxID=35708 RepID=A0A0A9BBP4_ARUDO